MHEKIIIVSNKASFVSSVSECLSGLNCLLQTYKAFDHDMVEAEQGGSGFQTLMVLDESALKMRSKFSKRKNLPPFIVVAEGHDDHSVTMALRDGALDIIQHPYSKVLMRHRVQSLFSKLAFSRQAGRDETKTDKNLGLSDLSEQCMGLNRAIQLGQRAARSVIPVLIEGESGVGKTALAKAIRQSSERRNKPFVSLNCSTNIADMNTTLFGDGGKLQLTGNGTLLLEEVGYLSIDLQLKLLDILNRGKFFVSNNAQPVKFAGRLIATTSQNLIEQVQRGLFSADLYYRISVFPISIPALRDRPEDVATLAKVFLRKYADCGSHFIEGIEPEAINLLENHRWHGNVRELENLIYRATMMAESWQLSVQDFPSLLSDTSLKDSHANALKKAKLRQIDDNSDMQMTQYQAGGYETRANASLQSLYGKLDLFDERGCLRRINDIEDEVIRFAIAHVGGNMSHVARDLGIGRTTLYRKTKMFEDEIEIGGLSKTA